MTDLLISLVLDPGRREEVLRHLGSDVAPWLRRRPGFCTSRWYLATDGMHCTAVITFSSPEAAAAAADLLDDGRNPARSWNVERVEVVEDLGIASRPAVLG